MTGAWLPKTFTTLSGYSRRQFLADLQAGVVVGIVAIPLATLVSGLITLGFMVVVLVALVIVDQRRRVASR